MHIEEEICECTFEARSPAFVHGETGAGDFGGGGQIQNSRALADFPVGARREVKFRWRAPAAHFYIIRGTGTHRYAGMRDIRNGKQQLALRIVKLANALIALLDEFRDLSHLRNDGIGRPLFFFEARDFVAGFVALRFALLILCDEFATLFVQSAESVEIEGGAAFGSHVRKNVEVLTKVT